MVAEGEEKVHNRSDFNASDSTDSLDLLTHFSIISVKCLYSANLEGIASKWLKLHKITDRNSQEERDYKLLKEDLRDKLWVLQLRIGASASALDNEEERAEQVAAYLRQIQDRREGRLTVAAIAAGGITSIVSGFILAGNNGSNSLEVIGIAGGLVGVGLSLPSLFMKKKAPFTHPVNPLKALWDDDNSQALFPESIWNFLHAAWPGHPPIREELISRWQQYGELSVEKDKNSDQKLYFGTGGKYTYEQLMNRASMLDQSEAAVNQMLLAISQLAAELNGH